VLAKDLRSVTLAVKSHPKASVETEKLDEETE